MKKSFRLALGAVLLTAVSASAGYMIGNSQDKNDGGETARTSDAETSRRAPRFTLHKQELSLDSEDKKAGLDFNKQGLDALLVRYSRMTPEQLEKEIKGLRNTDLFNGHSMNVKRLISAIYLSYKWGQISPKQAMEEAKSMGQLSMFLYPMVLQGWAETNPEMAAAYFSEHRDELPQSKSNIVIIAEQMGRTSPENAMKWLAGLNPEERETALAVTLSGIASTHPEQVEKCIGQLTPNELKDSSLCAQLASGWSRSDWDATNKWLQSLPEEQQQKARNAALATLGAKDAEKATAEFKKLDAKAQNSAAPVLAQSMAAQNPVKAMEWLTANTSEDVAAENMNNAIGYFNSGNPGVKEYITQMEGGPVKDSALKCLVERTSNDSWNSFVNFEETLDLTKDIKNQEKREESIKTALRSWRDKDPSKAKAWIESANLSESLKKEQLERCEQELKNKHE